MERKMSAILKVPFSDDELQHIADIIEKKDSCAVSIEKWLNTVWFKDKETGSETELRLLFLGNVKLTISRVCFKNRRQGTMTEILRYLEQLCREKEIEKIVFQSVETKEMMNFCLKNGYLPNPHASIEVGDFVAGDYEKKIEN